MARSTNQDQLFEWLRPENLLAWQRRYLDEGHGAFADGEDIADCPYALHSEANFFWDYGWAEAESGR